MKVYYLMLTGLMFVSSVNGQGFQTVFPGLSGGELIDSVASRYRPATVLDYTNARDTLYARVLNSQDDSIRCIYSGHTLYLDPTQDPTQYIFQNGGSNGMNTEHSYPVSKGATQGTNAYSDMHHLYPTRIAVNEARADKPFIDIPDAQTQKWFINNLVFQSIPAQNIERFAESGSDAFEPREASKGDVARSVFYFYTVYRNQANLADPAYFELQRNTLCQWNIQDPADEVELDKTWRIAAYQDHKPNPYVLDCTLASRSWCPDVQPVCLSKINDPAEHIKARLFPQPASSHINLALTLPTEGKLTCRFMDALGRTLITTDFGSVQAGETILPLKFDQLLKNQSIAGFLEVMVQTNHQTYRTVLPLLIQY
ncbi:MAG: endonuclease [Saprospiraceae bacterium]|nr:endonuclease [Saprospiraceae bacterium]